jgi:hypothetical protein
MRAADEVIDEPDDFGLWPIATVLPADRCLLPIKADIPLDPAKLKLTGLAPISSARNP